MISAARINHLFLEERQKLISDPGMSGAGRTSSGIDPIKQPNASENNPSNKVAALIWGFRLSGSKLQSIVSRVIARVNIKAAP